jgi:hypothetical protein
LVDEYSSSEDDYSSSEDDEYSDEDKDIFGIAFILSESGSCGRFDRKVGGGGGRRGLGWGRVFKRLSTFLCASLCLTFFNTRFVSSVE